MNLKLETSNLKSIWMWVRQLSGDAAYENYLRSCAVRGGPHILSREEFYLDALRRKYTGVSRCC